jgi:methyl-accepting chemotaxis protein
MAHENAMISEAYPAVGTGSQQGSMTARGAGTRRRSPAGGDQGGHGLPAIYRVFVAILFAYAVSLIVRHNGSYWQWLDGWGVPTFELIVAGLVLIPALLNRGERAVGVALGVAMSLWALGDFAMTIETLNGAAAPTLSTANILWAGFYPYAYIAVMLLVRREVKQFSVASWLDGLVAGLAVAAVFAAFAFAGIRHAAGGSGISVAVNLYYPAGDLLLLVMIVGCVAILRARRRTRWYLMAAACAVNALGDIAALFPSGFGASHAGYFFNAIAWPASLLLFSASVWFASSASAPVRAQERMDYLVPGIASGAAVVVLFVGSLHGTGGVAIGLATATLVAAAVRIGLSLARLSALNDQRHRQLAEAARTERDSREALQVAVARYSEFAAHVAEGDLTAVAAADEGQDLQGLSASLNSMVTGLADISGEVQAGVRDMRISTAEILASVSEYTESASQQSDAISAASTTVDEVRLAAHQTAASASEVAAQARDSVQVSDDGTRAVVAIAGAMEEIRERVDGIAHDVRTLSERTEEIGTITATVNDLADRSNLLALNASVEAARAGEHGVTFAVVAAEVRDLAEQSKAATAQVDRVLSDIQSATSAAVTATEQGTKVVAQGLQLTARAGDGINSLAETIRGAADAAHEIAASAQQQNVAVELIAQAMNQLKEGTAAQFLVGAQRSQKAAENLNELSEKLAALTERYRVGVRAHATSK